MGISSLADQARIIREINAAAGSLPTQVKILRDWLREEEERAAAETADRQAFRAETDRLVSIAKGY